MIILVRKIQIKDVNTNIISIFCDTNREINLSNKCIVHTQVEKINEKRHLLWDDVDHEKVILSFVETEKQITDIIT